MNYRGQVLLFGCSTGGLRALQRVFAPLPANFPWPIAGVCHVREKGEWLLPELLGRCCHLPVKGALEKEQMQPGHLYVAPPGYHLLLERDLSFSLSVDEKVHGSRPAIDPLFESAAASLGERVVAVILSGANGDGAQGARRIAERGGICIVQDPATAEAAEMPSAALSVLAEPQRVVLPLEEIAPYLCSRGAEADG
ncbi:chemotaxis protein CheB [Candidatus Magnetaquicoccus inordinatus]|uniref:chemotaxis protein CheB n=1 Tax=Candidatus Magnetaquicoccus inordinatus TaxID=2496818 RepID=UPI00102C3624|nr:chemotaxis protein CheB [Candidatus Magnetaquicoccus inordinatus]